MHHDKKYVLSHSYITLIGPESVHIVAGFINKNGVPVMYNSASNKFHRINWDLPFNKFGKYTKEDQMKDQYNDFLKNIIKVYL